MDENPQTPDAPAVEPVQPVAPVETPVTPDTPTTEPVVAPEAPAKEATSTVEPTEAVEDEEAYQPVDIPQVPQLDFSNLPVSDDNLIDPQALAGAINNQIAAAENRATARARQEYLEQQAEARGWEKAYEKYPELKKNRDLKDIVHRARLGEVTDLLSKTNDPSKVKFPTPSQTAEKIFKYMGTAKAEGMKQATENTVIQASAHVETAGGRTDDSADARTKAYQNINNSNKEVAKKARTDLLKSMLFNE